MATINEKLHSYLGIQSLIKELFNRMNKLEKAFNTFRSTSNGNSGSNENFIPLTGTVLGEEVSGDISFTDGTTDHSIKQLNTAGDSQSFLSVNGTNAGLLAATLDFSIYSVFDVDVNGARMSSTNPLSRGIIGVQDFTPNITDLDFVQYKLLPKVSNDFADDTAAALGGIVVGGMYHTTGVVKIRLV